MLKKLDIIILIYVQLIVFSLCFLYLSFDHELYVVKNLLLFIFFISVLISFIDKFFNLYQIFLLMMFVFNLALPIFESLGLYTYPNFYMILESDGINQQVSEQSMHTTYSTIIYFIIGATTGWLVGILKTYDEYKSSYISMNNKSFNKKFSFMVKVIFLIIFIMEIYANIFLFIQSRIDGYIYVMHLHSSSSTIFNIADALYKVSGVMLLFICKGKNQFIKYSLIFIFPFLIQFFTGARGETIAIIITLVFIYNILYGRISIKKYIFFGAILFFSIILVGNIRFSEDLLFVTSGSSFFETIINSIISTSKSIGVVAYSIELKDDFFNKVPFIFGYVDSIFSFAKNYTINGINEKNYLAQHITYLTNPQKLFNGSTIGSAYIAEVFLLCGGKSILIFIVGAISLYFAKIITFYMYKNIYLFYFGFVFLETFVLSPRGSMIKFFNKEFIISLVFITLIILTTSKINIKKKINNSADVHYE